MAKYCSRCNRKIGFFELEYDGMCEDCYNEYLLKLEEERKKQEEIVKQRLEKEKKKQEKLEQQRLEEEKKKQEKLEQQRLEEEKKKQEKLEQQRLEEEIKKQEEIEKKRLIQMEKRKKEREKKKKQKLVEQKKKKREEQKKEREEQKKIKEELKQKQLEEKKKRQEELNKKNEEKSNIRLNKIKEKILENPIVFIEYVKLFDSITNDKEKLNIFLPKYQDFNKIFLNIFFEVMKIIPINYSISHIEKMMSFNRTIEIMQKLNFMIKDNRQINEENIKRIPNSRKLNDNYNIVVGAKKYKYFYDPNQEIVNINNIVDTVINDRNSINIKIDDIISKIDNDISKSKTVLTENNREIYHNWFFNTYLDMPKYNMFGDDEDGILAKYEYNMRRFLGLQNEMNLMLFVYLYIYVILALYLLKISEYSLNIENNSEINQILKNLESSKINKEYIANKMYSLYEQFYLELFKERLCKADIYCMIYLIDKKNEYRKSKIQDIENYILNNNINFDVIDNSNEKMQTIKDFIVKFYKNNFNNKDLFDEKSIEAMILFIFNKYKVHFEFNELFELIKCFKETKNEILSLIKNKHLNEERIRLLEGDLSKELEIKKQEFDFNSVNSGYEFEEYVANLYKELGYKLIEITKKSGDQGADVVLKKDNIKYVVQAKFYSSPVGNKAVQEIVAALKMYKAQKGIVVTNNTFTNSAIELAKVNDIQLVDGNEINNLRKKILED